MLIIFPAHSEIVAVSYIRNYIQSNWNISLPVPTGTIASTKYLFSAIDATNQSLNGVATSYSSSASGGIVGKTLADRELTSGKIKYCAPGTYLVAGNNDCQNCGAGYYCTGGSHRQECTYKIATCPGINHFVENVPSSWTGKFNTYLSLDDLSAMNIPQTDISQWRIIACGRTQEYVQASTNAEAANAAVGDFRGTIGPGIYLFVESNVHETTTPQDYSSNIIVFDRQVGYKTVHTFSYYHIPLLYHTFVDTNNAVFQSFTLMFGENWNYNVWIKKDNVTGLAAFANENRLLCVLELM
jgi:hypothetical protein